MKTKKSTPKKVKNIEIPFPPNPHKINYITGYTRLKQTTANILFSFLKKSYRDAYPTDIYNGLIKYPIVDTFNNVYVVASLLGKNRHDKKIKFNITNYAKPQTHYINMYGIPYDMLNTSATLNIKELTRQNIEEAENIINEIFPNFYISETDLNNKPPIEIEIDGRESF